MSYSLDVSGAIPFESSIEVTDAQLDVMKAHGVDVLEESNVERFYRKHVGERVDGVYFLSLADIADEWNTRHEVEIDEFWVNGEPPERFWPDEEDKLPLPAPSVQDGE
ncbi:hypothetical protein DK926_18765 [Rhodococcus sp. Eu-32]|uniref:hypothetical protein n=1 Tax=Rhodococcus sp. Eu-32 TaxID=1017319 RepID=UPI000DF3C7AB|nr:hypothetical protein [Rhodococcus sp. Eu-32]RRQ26290.1 hypothetical protein DK926_18765 [Rhodococcus sp. Eu-32]